MLWMGEQQHGPWANSSVVHGKSHSVAGGPCRSKSTMPRMAVGGCQGLRGFRPWANSAIVFLVPREQRCEVVSWFRRMSMDGA